MPNNSKDLAPEQSDCRVLLVDDDESFRPSLHKTLEKLGYQVTSSTNGADAKRLIQAGARFNVVISDIRMPEMDGIELTRFIKSCQNPMPVILITGFSEILETQEAHALGADEFVPKPIHREELIDAIERCLLGKTGAKSSTEDQDSDYCRLGIEDFTSGRQIQFNVFIRLASNKYIKIAHKGEDLALDRIRSYKSKGISHLHLKREDFRTYVGFNLSLTRAVRSSRVVNREKKLNLLKHTGEILLEQLQHDGIDREAFDSSVAFVLTTIDIVGEDPDVMKLLEILNSHVDYLYTHSVGVSLYSVMLARAVEWSLPNNKFKVAVGGLLHDIGEKEIARELLLRPRKDWNIDEICIYECHPNRGVDILVQVRSIPSDVVQIVKEHHENCLAQGFPSRIRRSTIHPMAKLVAVANEFCDRVIRSPNSPGLAPAEALKEMHLFCSDRLEPQFFEALMRLFRFSPTIPPTRLQSTRQRH